MQMYDKHDMMIIMPMRICMKCFLKHAYVLEVLHEVECYVCMSMKCKEYVLWTMMSCLCSQECMPRMKLCMPHSNDKYEMSMN